MQRGGFHGDRWRCSQASIEKLSDTIDALAAFDTHTETGAQVSEGANTLFDGLPDLLVGDRLADTQIHESNPLDFQILLVSPRF